MKRIGIIGAMEEEVAALKKMLTDVETREIASMEFAQGKLGNKSAVVVRCGIELTLLFVLRY